MMKFSSWIFFVVLAALLVLPFRELCAEPPPHKPNPGMAKPTENPPPVSTPITAAKKSPVAKPDSLDLYAGLRDPFWPIGFSPESTNKESNTTDEKKQKKVEDPVWKEAIHLLDVKGVMNSGGNKYVAMINNQVVREGDEVSVQMGSLLYRWKVHSISKTGARFEPIDAKRPE